MSDVLMISEVRASRPGSKICVAARSIARSEDLSRSDGPCPGRASSAACLVTVEEKRSAPSERSALAGDVVDATADRCEHGQYLAQ